MKANKVWFENNRIYILTDTGEQLWQSLLWYPRLMEATDKQRLDYNMSPYGIHWRELDEDVSYESFTYAEKEPQNNVAAVLKSFPELNISQLARRMQIPQSLLASYVSGIKTPSEQRRKQIEDTLRLLGQELMRVSV